SAEARAQQFAWRIEDHVPEQARHLYARHAVEEPVRPRCPLVQPWLRAARRLARDGSRLAQYNDRRGGQADLVRSQRAQESCREDPGLCELLYRLARYDRHGFLSRRHLWPRCASCQGADQSGRGAIGWKLISNVDNQAKTKRAGSCIHRPLYLRFETRDAQTR